MPDMANKQPMAVQEIWYMGGGGNAGKYQSGSSGSSMDGWGGLKRGGADCRRSRPGEGAGGGHPSRPARGYGGALCYIYTELLVLSPKTPMYEFLI